MKTLIQNSTTGLMIGGVLVLIVAGAAAMSSEALAGAALLISAGIVKSIIS